MFGICPGEGLGFGKSGADRPVGSEEFEKGNTDRIGDLVAGGDLLVIDVSPQAVATRALGAVIVSFRRDAYDQAGVPAFAPIRTYDANLRAFEPTITAQLRAHVLLANSGARFFGFFVAISGSDVPRNYVTLTMAAVADRRAGCIWPMLVSAAGVKKLRVDAAEEKSRAPMGR